MLQDVLPLRLELVISAAYELSSVMLKVLRYVLLLCKRLKNIFLTSLVLVMSRKSDLKTR